MRKSSTLVLVLIGLFTVGLWFPPSGVTNTNQGSGFNDDTIVQRIPITSQDFNYEVTRNWEVNLVFVGLDQDVVNTTQLLSDLPSERVFPYQNSTFTWDITYNIHWANSTYENSLKAFMIANSVNGTDTGTVLNETALLEMTVDGVARDCFDPRDGRSINGTQVEDWLVSNPAVPTPDLGWTLYLLNYSEIDSLDHSLEHWFDYDPRDPDSDKKMDWFRLEWENELNPDIKYQYAGVGGRDQVYILDLSADQWYTKWAQLWWHETYDTMVGPHIRYDLDEYTKDIDMETSAGKDNVTEYIANYTLDVVGNLFFPTIHGYTTPTQNGSFRVMVFAMDEGVTTEEIEWIDNEDLIQAALDSALPFANWYVQVDFGYIDDYTDWNDTFYDNAQFISGEYIVDGAGLFFDIFYNLRPAYMLTEGYDTSVFGSVFMKKDMVMQYAGRNYTALGGLNTTMVTKSYERYYLNDGVTKKSGTSATQIHELGHAMGLMHTFSNSRYAADFQYGLMGYFGRHEKFSTFEESWLQSSYLDGLTDRYYKDFVAATEEIPEPWAQKTHDAKRSAEGEFELASNHYDNGDYMDCYESLLRAKNWTQRMLLSTTEDIAPEINAWGASPEPLNPGDSFTVYANITDTDSGVGEVELVMHLSDGSNTTLLLDWNSTHYSKVAMWPADSYSIELYITATDMAMNTESSDSLLFVETTDPTITAHEDITYTEGETGNEISWTVSDAFPGSYEVFKNGTSLKTGLWNSSSESITLSIDGLSKGTYNYTLVIHDIVGNTAHDVVLVTVEPEQTTTTTTSTTTTTTTTTETTTGSSTSPTSFIPDDTTTIIQLTIIVGACVVLGILILCKRRNG